MRTHISLPDDLVREIDEFAGARGRSAFIEDAIRRKLINERLKLALKRAEDLPGLDAEKYPYWATPELTSQWVHDMRRADQAYIDARRAARQKEREHEADTA
jgi:predicted transcriptional regulator